MDYVSFAEVLTMAGTDNYQIHAAALAEGRKEREARKKVSEQDDMLLLAEGNCWEIAQSMRDDEPILIFYLVQYYPVTNVIKEITAMGESELLSIKSMFNEAVEKMKEKEWIRGEWLGDHVPLSSLIDCEPEEEVE